MILTKSDLCDTTILPSLEARLRDVNPTADPVVAIRGDLDPRTVLGAAFLSSEYSPDEIAVRKAALASVTAIAEPIEHQILSRSYRFERPIDWDTLSSRLRAFMRVHGEKLLRLKAIVHLKGVDYPVALHGVHHTLYPPERLAGGAESDATSRLVVITEDLPPAIIDDLANGLAAA